MKIPNSANTPEGTRRKRGTKTNDFMLKPEYYISMALVIVTFVAFSQVLNNGFINFDDNVYITDNPHVQQGLTLNGITWAFTTGHATNWHPLTWISHMVEYELFGTNPAGHHFISLLLHIANSVLLFLVFRRISGMIWPSLLLAALFALHPLHVESVAWASEKKDVLSTFFWMLTLWTYVRYAEKSTFLRYLSVFFSLALGLLAKPMLVTLPFVLLLMDFWPLRRLSFERYADPSTGLGPTHTMPNRRESIVHLLREKIPLIVLVIASSTATYIAQQTGGSVSSLDSLPIGIRFSNALVAYVWYIQKMFWPDQLAVFYPHALNAIPLWKTVASGLLLCTISFTVIRLMRKQPYLAVGWFWFVGTLIPVIGIVQVGAQSMADRYSYVPHIGLFIMIAWGISYLLVKRPQVRLPLILVGASVILALAVKTWSQVGLWRDSNTLFEHALKVTTDNWLAHQQLGFSLGSKERYAEALPHYSEALRLRPYLEQLHYGIGTALSGLGRTSEAIAHFNEAIRLNPEYAEVYYQYGLTLARQGQFADAIARYEEALRIKPDYAEAHNNLGVALGSVGRVKEARDHVARALQINPSFAQAQNNMGNILMQEGVTNEAIEHYSEALRLNPDNSDARKNLDIALAKQKERTGTPTQPTQQVPSVSDNAELYFNEGVTFYSQGKMKEAISKFSEALRARPKYPEAHYNWGVVLHIQGNLNEAMVHYKKAIELNPDYAEAQYNLGVVFQNQGKIDDALAQYRLALRIKPDYPQVHNNIGVALYNQGKIAEAISHYKEALRLSPGYTEARNNLAVAEGALQQATKP